MHWMDDDLASAYLVESVGAARSELAALKAEAEKRPATARLLRAVARARRVHADKALMLLRGRIADTEANLAGLSDSMEATAARYKQMLAEPAGERSGSVSGFIDQFRRTVLGYRALLSRLGEEEMSEYHVCTVCGFIFEDQVRGRCPVCQAVEAKFERVD